ncbi:MAG: hypothetical protein R3C99_18850 [Pirellulaceae bacterium]
MSGCVAVCCELQPLAATKPLPELEIEAGEPIMRAQSPSAPSAPAANYWNDYQVPNRAGAASNNT